MRLRVPILLTGWLHTHVSEGADEIRGASQAQAQRFRCSDANCLTMRTDRVSLLEQAKMSSMSKQKSSGDRPQHRHEHLRGTLTFRNSGLRALAGKGSAEHLEILLMSEKLRHSDRIGLNESSSATEVRERSGPTTQHDDLLILGSL